MRTRTKAMASCMSEAKEAEFAKAIDNRIEYIRANNSQASAYAQMTGWFQGILPGMLTDDQADELIRRLNIRTKSAVSA